MRMVVLLIPVILGPITPPMKTYGIFLAVLLIGALAMTFPILGIGLLVLFAIQLFRQAIKDQREIDQLQERVRSLEQERDEH